MLPPFVLCPWEDGGIDRSVSSSFFLIFTKCQLCQVSNRLSGGIRAALMNNADARGGKEREGVIFFLLASERWILT